MVATRSGGGGSGFLLLVLPLLVFFAVGMIMRGGRHRRRPESHPVEAVSAPNAAMLRAEISVLADDVVRLEPQVTLHPDAQEDFDAATHRYRIAQTVMADGGVGVDLVRVQRVVDEATWAMARARAILQGRPPPEPPPPLQHPGRSGEPAIAVDDRAQPVYVGSPASFRSGWFGAGGGFGGLLLGSMLGGIGGWVVHESMDSDEAHDDFDGE